MARVRKTYPGERFLGSSGVVTFRGLKKRENDVAKIVETPPGERFLGGSGVVTFRKRKHDMAVKRLPPDPNETFLGGSGVVTFRCRKAREFDEQLNQELMEAEAEGRIIRDPTLVRKFLESLQAPVKSSTPDDHTEED